MSPGPRRYVDQVIRLSGGLLAAGAAYARQGSVYFRGEPAVRRSRLDLGTALRLSAEYGGGRTTPLRMTLWTWRSGRSASPAIRRGSCRGDGAVRGGTRNARPWPCRFSAPGSMFTQAALTCVSRITPATRRWPRRSPVSAPTRAHG